MRRFAALLIVCLAACQASSAPRSPEETCAAACTGRAPRCTHDQCLVGCNLALDRIIEHEMNTVLDCVAKNEARACDDPLWAHCATDIGPHADGGPPAPPPPSE